MVDTKTVKIPIVFEVTENVTRKTKKKSFSDAVAKDYNSKRSMSGSINKEINDPKKEKKNSMSKKVDELLDSDLTMGTKVSKILKMIMSEALMIGLLSLGNVATWLVKSLVIVIPAILAGLFGATAFSKILDWFTKDPVTTQPVVTQPTETTTSPTNEEKKINASLEDIDKSVNEFEKSIPNEESLLSKFATGISDHLKNIFTPSIIREFMQLDEKDTTEPLTFDIGGFITNLFGGASSQSTSTSLDLSKYEQQTPQSILNDMLGIKTQTPTTGGYTVVNKDTSGKITGYSDSITGASINPGTIKMKLNDISKEMQTGLDGIKSDKLTNSLNDGINTVYTNLNEKNDTVVNKFNTNMANATTTLQTSFNNEKSMVTDLTANTYGPLNTVLNDTVSKLNYIKTLKGDVSSLQSSVNKAEAAAATKSASKSNTPTSSSSSKVPNTIIDSKASANSASLVSTPQVTQRTSPTSSQLPIPNTYNYVTGVGFDSRGQGYSSISPINR